MTGLAYTDTRGRIYYDGRRCRLPTAVSCGKPCGEELIAAPAGAVTTMLPGRRPLRHQRPRTRGARRSRHFSPPATRDCSFRPSQGPGCARFAAVRIHVRLRRGRRAVGGRDAHRRARGLGAALLRRGRTRGAAARRACREPRTARWRKSPCARANTVASPHRTFSSNAGKPRCRFRRVQRALHRLHLGTRAGGQASVAPNAHRVRADADELARIAIDHLERVDDGIVSFGQGCEGEPLLRATTIGARSEGPRNPSERNDQPQHERQAAQELETLIDAGLQAVRISLNSFRPEIYAAYYRPSGYALEDVFAAVGWQRRGLRDR